MSKGFKIALGVVGFLLVLVVGIALGSDDTTESTTTTAVAEATTTTVTPRPTTTETPTTTEVEIDMEKGIREGDPLMWGLLLSSFESTDGPRIFCEAFEVVLLKDAVDVYREGFSDGSGFTISEVDTLITFMWAVVSYCPESEDSFTVELAAQYDESVITAVGNKVDRLVDAGVFDR